MRLDNVLHDCKAKACAALLTRTALVGAVETLEDALGILLGNALAIVLNLDKDLVHHIAETDICLTALLAVTNRVDD